MEQLFTYEFAKETLVLAAYGMLIGIEIWWVVYVIVSIVKWIVKMIKKFFKRKNNVTKVHKEEE